MRFVHPHQTGTVAEQKETKISCPQTWCHSGVISIYSALSPVFDDTAKCKPNIISRTAVIEIIYMATFHSHRGTKKIASGTVCEWVDCHISRRFVKLPFVVLETKMEKIWINIITIRSLKRMSNAALSLISSYNWKIVIKSELQTLVFLHVISNLRSFGMFVHVVETKLLRISINCKPTQTPSNPWFSILVL